ncbi:MAG: hypothetical protein NXH95_09265 [Pseudomonadaceae bacterium]|nr:hypothetical protein [Pseudomonadaceae bacterium]
MQKRPWAISDLLALRDGQPHSADVQADDPQVIEQLEQIRGLGIQLNALPDVPVDDEVWLRAMPAEKPRSVWLRYPTATAASVFFASVVGMFMLFGEPVSNIANSPGAAQYTSLDSMDNSGAQLAGLMRQSRDLEQQLYGVNPLAQAADTLQPTYEGMPEPTVLEESLLFRLADVDGQIARLYDATEMDSAQRQALWMKRVELLESLVAIRSGDAARLFDNSRSM